MFTNLTTEEKEAFFALLDESVGFVPHIWSLLDSIVYALETGILNRAHIFSVAAPKI